MTLQLLFIELDDMLLVRRSYHPCVSVMKVDRTVNPATVSREIVGHVDDAEHGLEVLYHHRQSLS